MRDIFDQLLKRLHAGERVVLCVVAAARGSTPQGAGAKMLVTQAGQLIGTLGGGCVEAEVRQRALQILGGDKPVLLPFRLDHDYGWDDGLICGGNMDILILPLSSAEQAGPFAGISEALAERRAATLRLAYTVEGAAREYAEELRPDPVLVIAGAGHVGQALARAAATLGFAITVIDDRADFVAAERFPANARLIAAEVEPALAAFPIDGETYIVIVTRGHRHDGRALQAVVQSPARFVGLIGSRRKILTIMGDLALAGVPREALLRVHAPIGLAIGAITPEEIAVSIAAELVAVRRGAEVMSLKIDPTLAAAAIERALASPSSAAQPTPDQAM